MIEGHDIMRPPAQRLCGRCAAYTTVNPTLATTILTNRPTHSQLPFSNFCVYISVL